MKAWFRTLLFITRHPLNRGREWAALIRYLRWQIGSRLLSLPVIYPWIDGVRFIVRRGDVGLTGNMYVGLDEFEEMGFVLHVLRPSDLFVDVGANVGSYSLLAAGFSKCEVVAFEPVSDTFNRLVRNIEINKLDARVKCIHSAVGEAPGFVQISNDQDSMNHVVMEGGVESNTESVEVKTLDHALNGRVPFVMKIDVEGFEIAVLKGAEGILRSEALGAIIIELNGAGERYDRCDSDIVSKLDGYGFLPFRYSPLRRELSSVIHNSKFRGNLIFTRGEAIKARLVSAPQVLVHGTVF